MGNIQMKFDYEMVLDISFSHINLVRLYDEYIKVYFRYTLTYVEKGITERSEIESANKKKEANFFTGKKCSRLCLHRIREVIKTFYENYTIRYNV